MAHFGECIGPPGAVIHHDRCPHHRHGMTCSCWCHLDKCPECKAGKCRNCDGQTWDHERDQPGVCPCWVGHEKEEV